MRTASNPLRSFWAREWLATSALILGAAIVYALSWIPVARQSNLQHLFSFTHWAALLVLGFPFAWALLLVIHLSLGEHNTRDAARTTAYLFAVIIGCLSLSHVLDPQSYNTDMAALGLFGEAFVGTAGVTVVAPISYLLARSRANQADKD